MSNRYIAESHVSALETLENLHEEYREDPVGFCRAAEIAGISYQGMGHFAWRALRKYESSQADVQLQKRLRKLGK